MRTALSSLLCLALLFLATLSAFIWLPASSHYQIAERYVFTAGEREF